MSLKLRRAEEPDLYFGQAARRTFRVQLHKTGDPAGFPRGWEVRETKALGGQTWNIPIADGLKTLRDARLAIEIETRRGGAS